MVAASANWLWKESRLLKGMGQENRLVVHDKSINIRIKAMLISPVLGVSDAHCI